MHGGHPISYSIIRGAETAGVGLLEGQQGTGVRAETLPVLFVFLLLGQSVSPVSGLVFICFFAVS